MKTMRVLTPALLILLTMFPVLALANGYYFLHQSAEGMGSAYATNGTGANDISAMFSNPASIIRFDGTRVSGGLVLDSPRSSLENATATAPYGDPGDPISGTPQTPKQPIDTAVGAATYMTHEARPGLVYGVSFGAPYAYVSDYPDTAVSRYTATKTGLQALNLSPTVAFRINDRWAVGGSVNLQYYSATLDTMVATSATNPTTDTDIESSIEASDFNFGYSLGFEYQASENTRIGASFRSAIGHSFDGDLELNGSAANYASLVALSAANGIDITSATGSAKFDIKTPFMLQVGLLHKLSDTVELYANANRMGWSAFKDTRISYSNGLSDTIVDNDWNDSWFVALGFGYQYTDKLKFRTGAAYDWTPTPAGAVSPRAPNNDRWNVGFGFSYQKSKNLKLDFGYQYIKFTKVTIALAGGNNTPRGTLNGNIELYANVLMTQLNYKF